MKRLRLGSFTGAIAFAVIVWYGCGDKSAEKTSILFPEAGARIKAGEKLLIDLDFVSRPDSVIYLVDSTVAARKTDTSAVSLQTDAMKMGNHLITARVFTAGTADELTSNVIILPGRAPVPYTFEVVNTYPHDISSYVEGLEYHDGLLYESDGGDSNDGRGGSSLRLTELKSGKVLKKVDIPDYFAEGITVIGNKIVQLTWKDKVGFVYDKKTFAKLAEFPYQDGREGWGLAFDGTHILNTDGSNSIYFLDKDTYEKRGFIEVYDDQGPVKELNEIEYIDGKIYANVYTKPIIVIIDPKTGIVEARIDLTSLLPNGGDSDYVLNGIAWDKAGKRLFITGKLWDKLYEIKVIKN